MLYFIYMNDTVKNTKANTKKKTGLKPPWKPGESGNPKGRPKKEDSLSDMIRAMLADQDVSSEEKRTCQASIIRKAIYQAIGGDHNARCWLADRAWGKAVERVITRDGDMDLIIE